MSCYHPLKGFVIGKTINNKKLYKICNNNTLWCTHLETGEHVIDYDLIPCGHCIGCKLDYAREWSIRCMLEASQYDENYFLTITYNDESNPRILVKDDLRRFISSVRKSCERKGFASPRFFAAGEYGSSSLRCHFHCIMFNLHLDDLKVYKRTPNGILYTSDTLNNIWHKGFIVIGEVNTKTCGYVARYCTKKLNHDELTKYGFTKEFVLMSRRPGIGFGYYDKNLENIYKYDSVIFNFGDFNSITPPKYYDYLLNKVNPDLLEKLKNFRKKKAEITSSLEFLQTTLATEEEYLKVKESVKNSQIKSLKRSQI